MELNGIDVSAYQGAINHAAASAAGIKFAILRISEQGNKTDATFEANYKGFTSNKVKVGVYKFSYALNTADAAAEASSVLSILNNRKLDFPVFYDLEWEQQRKLPKASVSALVKAFRDPIIKAGYQFGIYCNTDWYNNVLDRSAMPYEYWLASYPYKDTGAVVEGLRPSGGVGWQYSSKGTVSGISGNVDMDLFYKDYSSGPPAVIPVTPVTSVSQRTKMIVKMQSYLGLQEPNGDDIIIKLYNGIRPAGSYQMAITDPWCHATIAVAAYESGNGDIIPITAYCPDGINWFKAKGRWHDRTSGYVPLPGDIIYYDWAGDGVSDHVGMVETVLKTTLTVIEGNKNDACERRVIDMSSTYIMGYGAPVYKTIASSSTPSVTDKNPDGTVTIRKGDTLTALAKQFNTTVEQIITDNKPKYPTITSSYIVAGWILNIGAKSGYTQWVGKCTADHVNVRKGAGTDQPILAEYPELHSGNLVDVQGESKASNGNLFYNVVIAKKYIGYVSAKYLVKV